MLFDELQIKEDIEQASYLQGYKDASEKYQGDKILKSMFWIFTGGVIIGASFGVMIMSLRT